MMIPKLLGLDAQFTLDCLHTIVGVLGWFFFGLTYIALQVSVVYAIKTVIIAATIAGGLLLGYSMRSIEQFRRKHNRPQQLPATHAGAVHARMIEEKREREPAARTDPDALQGTSVPTSTAITGHPEVDHELEMVIDLLLRDYVNEWYKDISTDSAFIDKTKATLTSMIALIATRCEAVNWFDFFTKTVADIFIKHVQLFWGAIDLVEADLRQQQKSMISIKVQKRLQMVEDKFFLMDKTHQQLCSSPDHEKEYLRDVSEAILFSFLEEKDFNNEILRLPLREILALTVFEPLATMMSDPDYINQVIACSLEDPVLDYNALVDTIKASTDISELNEIYVTINQFIAEQTRSALRKKDTQFAKILDAMRLCEARIAVVSGKPVEKERSSELEESYKLSLQFVLKNEIANTYFQTFLDTIGKKDLLDCWKSMQSFRINTCLKKNEVRTVTTTGSMAQEQLAVFSKQMMDSTRSEAFQIYYQYFADDSVSFVSLGKRHLAIVAELHAGIQQKSLSEILFDPAEHEVSEQLEELYRSFLRSDCYYHCIVTLQDRAPEQLAFFLTKPKSAGSNSASRNASLSGATNKDAADARSRALHGNADAQRGGLDEDGEDDGDASAGSNGEDVYGWWEAEIVDTEMTFVKKKSVVVYKIKVTYISKIHGAAREWYVYRRYSDFSDFHDWLLSRFKQMLTVDLTLPPKRIMSIARNNKDFLHKRLNGLRTWLKDVLSHSVIEKPGLKKAVSRFLSEEKYERVKSASLASKVFGGASKQPASDQEDTDSTQQLLADMKLVDLKASVPFRIILALLDVVFKLHSNPWMRRRVMPVVQSLLKTFMGGSINRKVHAAIDGLMSPEQVSEWVAQYRETSWPDDHLAPAMPDRSIDDCRSTRIEARAKLLGVIPDELKTIIGHDTAKKGILGLFDLFQHPRLNKRLYYKVIEALFVRLLPPPSQLTQLIEKLHEVHQA